MKFYWTNFIDQADFYPSSTKIGYDVSVLKNKQRGRVFDFDDNDVSLRIDLKEAKPVEYFIMDVGNLTPGSIVTLKANDDDDWIDPPFETMLDYQGTCFMAEFEIQPYQWWRLEIQDVYVDTIRFGTISIGFSPLQLPGIRENALLFFNTTNTNQTSISGQIYPSPGYEYLDTTFIFSTIKEDNYNVGDLTISSRYEVQSFWSECRNILPYWAILWENNIEEFPPLYVINEQNDLTFEKQLGKGEFQFDLRIREVL